MGRIILFPDKPFLKDPLDYKETILKWGAPVIRNCGEENATYKELFLRTSQDEYSICYQLSPFTFFPNIQPRYILTISAKDYKRGIYLMYDISIKDIIFDEEVGKINMLYKNYANILIGARFSSRPSYVDYLPAYIKVIKEAFVYIDYVDSEKGQKYDEKLDSIPEEFRLPFGTFITGNLIIEHINRYNEEELENIYERNRMRFEEDFKDIVSLIDLFGFR